jgi:hypothetical protein
MDQVTMALKPWLRAETSARLRSGVLPSAMGSGIPLLPGEVLVDEIFQRDALDEVVQPCGRQHSPMVSTP